MKPCPSCGWMLRDVDEICTMCGARQASAPPGYPPATVRITATDISLARSAGAGILLGKAFAFIGPDAFKSPALAWAGRILGSATPARVVPLLGADPVPLPGADVAPAEVPALSLASVTSDKAL